MKVLYFHQHFCTPDGSTGIRSYTMAKRLINDGHFVTMICGSFEGANTGLAQPFQNGSRRGYVDGIDVVEFDLRYGNSDGYIRRTYTMFRYFFRASILIFRENLEKNFLTFL